MCYQQYSLGPYKLYRYFEGNRSAGVSLKPQNWQWTRYNHTILAAERYRQKKSPTVLHLLIFVAKSDLAEIFSKESISMLIFEIDSTIFDLFMVKSCDSWCFDKKKLKFYSYSIYILSTWMGTVYQYSIDRPFS